MDKYFNIAGPCFPNRHYMLPALDRMPEIRRLVDQEMYFVIHAPRPRIKPKRTRIPLLSAFLQKLSRHRLVPSLNFGKAA